MIADYSCQVQNQKIEFWINISKHHNHPFGGCYTANFMGEEIEAKNNKSLLQSFIG